MSDQPGLEAVPEDWSRGLAVAAHPDDLEYGTASAVARWTSQGKQIVYLIVTRGEAGIDAMPPEVAGPIREEEERRSAAVVGVQTVEFLDYRDGVVEYGLPLRRDIARVIRRYRPEVVITGNFQLTWGGASFNMADHRAVGLAVLDAARDAANRWVFPELTAAGLEPWSGVKMVCTGGSPDAASGVDISDFIEQGVASLKEHREYIAGLGTDFDPDSFLKDRASWAGAEMNVRHAVKFRVFQI